MKKNSNLTAFERDMIGFYFSRGESIRSIASKLDRGKSTISDEIRRNSVNGVYLPILAETKSKQRISGVNSQNPRKNHLVWAYVVRMLKKKWSPELISGRLREVLYSDDPSWWISAECIYARIYSKENENKQLWKFLPRKHRKRKSKYRKRRGAQIPDRVSIHNRSQEVENRKEFGHWEGDSVVSKGRRSGLHTEVERKSRLLQVKKISKVNSQKSLNAQYQIFSELPGHARKSTTLDNGSEFTKHTGLHRLGMNTYFADPYSSWQRGSNEWHNGLIRRYFPKGTDFSTISHLEIEYMQREINNRPRKVLGYKTPREVFDEEVKIAKCPDS